MPGSLSACANNFGGCTSNSPGAQWLASGVGVYYLGGRPVRAAKASNLLRDQIFGQTRIGSRERRVSIPNIITLGRILLVPIIVWAIASSQMEIAFSLFIVA